MNLVKSLISGVTCSVAATLPHAQTSSNSPPIFVEDAPLVITGRPNGIVRYRNDELFVAVTVSTPSSNVASGNTTSNTSTSGSTTGSSKLAQVQIFKRVNGAFQQTGTVLLKSGDSVNGLDITPDGTTLLASLEQSGIALVDVNEALKGRSTPAYVDQSNGGSISRPGSFQTAITPDGKYAFVANEYGQISSRYPAGNIGVISLTRNRHGVTEGTPLGFIPLVGGTIPGVSVSRDGKRVYAVSEVVSTSKLNELSGMSNSRLASDQCLQSNPDAPKPNGELAVIDVKKAIHGARVLNGMPNVISGAVVTNVATACSPVRVVESPDGSSVWVTARGSNELLQFDTGRLVHDPDGALLQVISSNGVAPVDVAIFDEGRHLMLTNSDRFSDTSTSPVRATADITGTNISIFDIARPTAKLIQTLPTGYFPRDIAVSPHGRAAFVTDYDSSSVTVLRHAGASSTKGAGVSPFGN